MTRRRYRRRPQRGGLLDRKGREAQAQAAWEQLQSADEDDDDEDDDDEDDDEEDSDEEDSDEEDSDESDDDELTEHELYIAQQYREQQQLELQNLRAQLNVERANYERLLGGWGTFMESNGITPGSAAADAFRAAYEQNLRDIASTVMQLTEDIERRRRLIAVLPV